MPWYNRPNVRLQRYGAGILSDAELLAIVLGRGSITENALDCSNRILKTVNFHNLGEKTLVELENIIGDNVKALKIVAMAEIFKRTSKLVRKGFKFKIKNAEDVYNYYADSMKDLKKEHFYALMLDTKNNIIKEELISIGTLNSSLIHPREVFKPAIKASANSIILVHNHPSGDPTPSSEDREITEKLRLIGEMAGIKILDHIIVGNEGFVSF